MICQKHFETKSRINRLRSSSQTVGLNNALEELKLQIKNPGQAESQEDRATLVAFSGELDTLFAACDCIWCGCDGYGYPCTLLFGV